jgi:type II secretory pathway component GspD/PulD (secretin)
VRPDASPLKIIVISILVGCLVAQAALSVEQPPRMPAQPGQPAVTAAPGKQGLPVMPLQTPPPPPVPQAVQPQQPTNMASVGGQPVIRRHGDVSFNFDDADLLDVIQTVFGDILKLNYMVDPKVKGRVHFRTVAPVPKDEALMIMDALLKMNGAGFMYEKGIYRILPVGEVTTSTPKVNVYPLQNSKAAYTASLLQSIVGGSVSGGVRPAATTPGAGPKATTGSTSYSVSSGTFLSGETKIIPDEINNSIIVIATQADYAFVEETIKKIDISPRQVMIEAVVAAITLTDNMRFGLMWSMDINVKASGLHPFTRPIDINGPLELNSLITGPNFTYTAKDPSNNVRLIIQSLAQDNKAKVLSSPHILVSDNREARIQIGDQIPIATSTTTNTATTPAQTTTTIQYKDTGTILKVRPQVNDSGLISLELSQEVSTVSTQKVLGTDQYVISKREVTSNLVAQDGQTIVIGGLINESTTKERAGIPLLSRIPLLGYLFGSTIDDNTRTELIILLTPRVIKSSKDAVAVSGEYVDRLKGTGKDMQIDSFIRKPAAEQSQKAPAPVAPVPAPAPTAPAPGTMMVPPKPAAAVTPQAPMQPAPAQAAPGTAAPVLPSSPAAPAAPPSPSPAAPPAPSAPM